ncbi:hypothetical protein [Algoriphagus boritolerans]|uniref:Uncharacterized protein n=1 Tax=Algoriphagus boritolerans DSM 17298 = JCM 18970 TaxID=1120964 RepID=A0A1H5S8R2_9BACT|nr:hypothetical protein [Algoriphagus boritolerans]SEF46996.1 hypothetical protein SAMN03080598_00339 [Algoriphagus boritolerans DSM 17298 = JCM 18970]
MKKLFLFTLLICLGAFASFAQKGNKERIKVHSKALEGNLIGDSADRDVTVYLDLPVQNGEPRQDVINKIIANRTLNFVDQYILNLKKLKAIGMDAGLQDRSISNATKTLHEILDSYQIDHVYESYEGDHLNRIAE